MTEQLTQTFPDPFYYRGFRLEFDPPPIPDRSHDWRAYHEDGEGALLCFGKTRLTLLEDIDRQHSEWADAGTATRRGGAKSSGQKSGAQNV